MLNGPANRPARSVCVRRSLRRLGLCLLAAAGLALFLALFRVPILTGLAAAWVVNETPTKADAIVVLGGGLEDRPFAAAKLYHEGFAPKILYMDVKPNAAVKLGVGLPERELTRQVLLSNNVPENAIVAIGNGVTSTYDESRAVRAWLEKSGCKSILIPTDVFHTRRVRWVFNRELDDMQVQIRVQAVQPPAYSAKDWWQHEEGLIAFESEVVKSIYYHFKY
jgi:uncharacterized SAM-binding protein YcdF (DUF218 family)